MSDVQTSVRPGAEDERIRTWFARLAGCSGGDRARVLAELKRDAPDIAGDVESLAAYLETSVGVLDRSAADVAAELSPSGGHSGVVGPAAIPVIPGFRIVREIGRGGMGIVYEAEQEYPRRLVALKVIRPDLMTASVLQRFTLEAEALALLHDPGIAQLYEAGFFGEGAGRTPYFAMELVEGVPLTVYVRERGLTVPERVRLFARVCDAVEHAHRRGVLHRDLKPGNILVNKDGAAKVLDFGVARLAGAAAPDHTLTRAGQIIGTLGYMSPEQVEGDPRKLDQRSDVYSLGVILYELVSGQMPMDLSGMSVTRAALTLRDREPTRLGQLDPALKGDMESIACKALEKDVERRYATAAEMAADLRRSLNHEVVLARPQTRTYLARKFVRRHRVLVTAITGVFLALTAGAGGTAWQAVRATRERNMAAEQADRAKHTAEIVQNMIKAVRPEASMGRQVTLREVLAGATLDLDAIEASQPLVAADTHTMLAEAFASLGEFESVVKHARKAYELHLSKLGPDHLDTLHDAGALASALSATGKDEEAERVARPALERALRVHGENATISIGLETSYGYVLSNMVPSRDEESVGWLERALKGATAVFPRCDARRMVTAMDLSVVLMDLGRLKESRPLMEEVYECRRTGLGEDHPDTVIALGNLAVLNSKDGGMQQALESSQQVFDKCTRILGPSHPTTIRNESNLAAFLVRSGQPKESTAHARHAYEAALAQFGPTHRSTLLYCGMLASTLKVNGELDEAEKIGHRHYDLCLSTFGRGHEATVLATTLMYDLAEARDDLPGMQHWVDELQGTKWGAEAARQLEEAKKRVGEKK